MEINEKNIKMFSTIGPRATLGLAALEIAKKDNSLIIITCDVSTISKEAYKKMQGGFKKKLKVK